LQCAYFIFQLIGDNNVAVPTHLFKVIIVENKRSQPFAMATFIVPNEPIGFEVNLKEYQVHLRDLESIVGIKLTPKLDPLSVKDLCKVDGCKLIGKNEFELYFIGRKLASANTLHRLNKVWSELEEKKLKPDRYLTDLYRKKQSDLEQAPSTQAG